MSKEEMEKAKALVEKKKALSGKDVSCMSCHDQSADQKWKRSSLKKAAKEMQKQINKCISEPERIGGKKLEPKDEKLRLIESYLLHTYRVSG